MDENVKCPNCNREITKVIQPGFCPNCGHGYNISSFERESIQRRILAEHSNEEYSRELSVAGPKDRPKDWFMKREYITASLSNNQLVSFLNKIFDETVVRQVAAMYRLETHTRGEYDGAAIFYQYDDKNICKAFKVIQYDEDGHRKTGERRNPKNEKDLLYQKSLIGPGEYCLFGKHLLNREDAKKKPICIVESEKSAIIASIAYPEAIWMAAGSCFYLFNSKIDEEMAEHKIILFPDVDVKYEPIDIDETTGISRCINWYLIKKSPHGIGLRAGLNVIVSGFLDTFIKGKCEKCSQRENCSSSPFYSPDNSEVQNREISFSIDPYHTIKTIPKIVLERKEKKIECPRTDGYPDCVRGWDIGDYIISAKLSKEQLVPFEELIRDIDESLETSIITTVNIIEQKIDYTGNRNRIEKLNLQVKTIR